MIESAERLAEQVLKGHQLSPATYVELRASITTALERVAITAAAGAAADQVEKDCRAHCPMCRTGKDLLLAGAVEPAIERGALGNWDHPSLSVPGLFATCLASCIRGEWVGRPREEARMRRVYRGYQIGEVQVTWWWHPMYWEFLWTPRHLVVGPLDIWRAWPGLR